MSLQPYKLKSLKDKHAEAKIIEPVKEIEKSGKKVEKRSKKKK